MNLKNQRCNESIELKNIKNQKFGALIRKTLDDQVSALAQLKEKSPERFDKERAAFRKKISDLINIQEENIKISESNLEVLEENIKIETKNIEVSEKNKEYLSAMYDQINKI